MGSDQRFSLRWNNYQSHLVTAFESLLDEKDFIDVTLGVEGRKLPAHKMLLSACSPYFRELLKGNPCQHPIIILRDIKYDDLFSLLQFMYNGEVNVAQDQLNSFLKSAESLKIRGLTDNESENVERPAVAVPPPRERLQDNDLQPPPVKKKRPYPESVPIPHTSPSPTISAPPPPKRPQQSPAPAPRPEPVKQEIIELSDDHYENTEQYAPDPVAAPNPVSAYGQDTANQSYDDGGAHAMVPAEEGGMEDMQGDGTQGQGQFWNLSEYQLDDGIFEGEGYPCNVCPKAFKFRSSLSHHMKTHTGEATCPKCGKVLSSKANMIRHMRNC